MDKKQFFERLRANFDKGLNIIEAKNADYSGEEVFRNFESVKHLGIDPAKGILVRMMDKMTRISNLLDREGQVQDEKIEDTLIDLANYANILNVYLKK